MIDQSQLLPFYYPKAKANEGEPLRLRTGSIIPFYKPLDWTSFDLVNKFRNSIKFSTGLRKIKVGHSGTLDPKASGVLVLCTGKCTKHIEQLMEHEKEYVATVMFGATTPSFDTEHVPDHFYPYKHITREALCTVLERFIGDIEQVPPLFSAISVDGNRAYDLARKGKEVELAPKKVFIESIDILHFELPKVTLRIRCGKGTYIRSLARDLGQILNSGAYLSALERVEVGGVTLDECFSVEEIPALLSCTATVEEGYEQILQIRPLLY